MEQTRILYSGNSDLVTRVLNEARDGYDEDAVVWSGLISTNITLTQENTPLSSDNDPEKDVIKGIPSGTGTITLRGIKYKDFLKLMNVKYDDDDGIDFGSDEDLIKYFSLSFTEMSIDGDTGEKGKVRHMFYRVRINNLPTLASSTISNSSVEPRDFPLDVAIMPLMKPNDTMKWKFYRVQSDIDNMKGFNANKGTITFPYTITPPTP